MQVFVSDLENFCVRSPIKQDGAAQNNVAERQIVHYRLAVPLVGTMTQGAATFHYHQCPPCCVWQRTRSPTTRAAFEQLEQLGFEHNKFFFHVWRVFTIPKHNHKHDRWWHFLRITFWNAGKTLVLLCLIHIGIIYLLKWFIVSHRY